MGRILSSTSLVFPLLRLLQNAPCVEAAAALDHIVHCGVFAGNKICATLEFYTPNPCTTLLPNGTEVTEDLGGWSTVFNYLDGENVTDGMNLFDQMDSLEDPPSYNEVVISVEMDDDEVCRTTVNNNGTQFDCASCTWCGVYGGTGDFSMPSNFELDCTNVEINENMVFTRALTCEDSIFPVLFQLVDNGTLSDNGTLDDNEEEPEAGVSTEEESSSETETETETLGDGGTFDDNGTLDGNEEDPDVGVSTEEESSSETVTGPSTLASDDPSSSGIMGYSFSVAALMVASAALLFHVGF